MRMILIDHARQTRALKRSGSGAGCRCMKRWRGSMRPVMRCSHWMWLWISWKLVEERKVRVIELRFFLGCTNEETAQLLDVSRATIDRDLEFAKTWLYRRLSERPPSLGSDVPN